MKNSDYITINVRCGHCGFVNVFSITDGMQGTYSNPCIRCGEEINY